MKLGVSLLALAAGAVVVGLLVAVFVVGGQRADMVRHEADDHRGGQALPSARPGQLATGFVLLLVGAGAWGLWTLASGPLRRHRAARSGRICRRCGARAGPQDGVCVVCGSPRLGPARGPGGPP